MSPASLTGTEQSIDGASPRELYLFSQGATEWAYSAADESVTFRGRRYAKETIARGSLEFSEEDTAGSLEVHLPRGNALAQLFVPFLPAAPVHLTVYRVHRDGTYGVIFWGQVANAVQDGSDVVLTCAPMGGLLARKVPRLLYGSQCQWALYGAGCAVNADDFKHTATLSGVSGLTISSSTFDAQPDGYFRNGWVELASGERRMVVQHVGAVLTLAYPFADLSNGDSVTAFAGCDRTEAVCAGTFGNLDNFFGFPRVPSRNPHEGRVA